MVKPEGGGRREHSEFVDSEFAESEFVVEHLAPRTFRGERFKTSLQDIQFWGSCALQRAKVSEFPVQGLGRQPDHYLRF
jgi:hypothetical protein